jgi:hypothetical protein
MFKYHTHFRELRLIKLNNMVFVRQNIHFSFAWRGNIHQMFSALSLIKVFASTCTAFAFGFLLLSACSVCFLKMPKLCKCEAKPLFRRDKYVLVHKIIDVGTSEQRLPQPGSSNINHTGEHVYKEKVQRVTCECLASYV